MLEHRYKTTWAEFSASEDAVQDRERFVTSLYRKNFPHVFPPPVFSAATVDAATVDSVESVGVAMARLVDQAPTRVFGHDVAAWMDYLGVPAVDRGLLQAAVSSPRLRDIATTFMRPDPWGQGVGASLGHETRRPVGVADAWTGADGARA